ncbi:hypothetical protein Dda_5154 [Drechslerella dactyloides]|uniref:Uncharacterized protein n=1 Tax=Drechslerella dactyloides TaxID=74499 RepID=A0AAD6IWA1_DREDA|nr:hypothetical protein Dda_5154 [Drechslerella dactyloides]
MDDLNSNMPKRKAEAPLPKLIPPAPVSQSGEFTPRWRNTAKKSLPLLLRQNAKLWTSSPVNRLGSPS